MDNLTNFERSIIVHALFKYAEYAGSIVKNVGVCNEYEKGGAE